VGKAFTPLSHARWWKQNNVLDESHPAEDSRFLVRNLKVTLSYDGSEFSGWQIQPDTATIQGTLAIAIRRITGEKVLPQGSGRTDAGVHALAQVASFQLTSPIPEKNLLIALNDLLPGSIRVLAVSESPAEFHARTSAVAKTYVYRVYRDAICPPFLARYVWHYPYPLEEQAMQRGSAAVVGEHDFTAFAAVDPERFGAGRSPSNVRTIFSCQWERGQSEFALTVRGSGFLHHMVRNLVGTFVGIGRGTWPSEDMARILSSRDRSLAGATAPARGLYLASVEY
jgi:tRNA pseudouridine38-40 synthase